MWWLRWRWSRCRQEATYGLREYGDQITISSIALEASQRVTIVTCLAAVRGKSEDFYDYSMRWIDGVGISLNPR
jgi:hypothetical protein